MVEFDKNNVHATIGNAFPCLAMLSRLENSTVRISTGEVNRPAVVASMLNANSKVLEASVRGNEVVITSLKLHANYIRSLLTGMKIAAPEPSVEQA